MATAVRDVHPVSDGQKFAADQTLEAHSCPTCGILHAVPERLVRAARDHPMDRPDGWTLHCLMGHSWGFTGQSEAERLREQLKCAREESSRRSAQLDQARAGLRAQKAAKTRYKNQRDRDRARVAAGLCPCCNRTFQNLARHMAGQHPEFPAPDGTQG